MSKYTTTENRVSTPHGEMLVVVLSCDGEPVRSGDYLDCMEALEERMVAGDTYHTGRHVLSYEYMKSSWEKKYEWEG